MNLYEIIKATQAAQGSNAKLAILQEHKDNELLKAFMKAVMDPAINYYIAQIPKPPYPWNLDWMDWYDQDRFEFGYVLEEIEKLSNRTYTGNSAKKFLHSLMSCISPEGKELLTLIIKRSAGAGIGDSMILKVWPDLYFLPPYQRCVLMDSKIKEKFSKLSIMYVQPKLDGSFLYLVKEGSEKVPEAITRAGSKYPTWFAEKLSDGVLEHSVLIGEVEVYEQGVLLNRQTGNGVLNSVLQEGGLDEFDKYDFRMTCWDTLFPDNFKNGLSNIEYKHRLNNLDVVLENNPPNVRKIQTYEVTSLAEAYKIYSEHTARGEEGCVLKNPDSIWKDGTSKDNVKLKIQFEAEYIVTAMYEGEGKAKGMLGGITIETSDGLLKSNCGTGFSDDMRKAMWQQPGTVVGSIVTIKANDVISSRDSDIKSLFLPVYSDTRFDKKEADSLARVMEQLEAAKSGL